MKQITMIAAIGKNRELGKNNQLIWQLKKDLAFFKEQTIKKPVVMGIKTLESLPKLLPERKHIVLTRRNLHLQEEIVIVHSKEELLEYMNQHPEEYMVIGGASIYSQMLENSDKLILTEVEAEDKDADVYFPEFLKEDWDSMIVGENEDNGIRYKHLVYKRKRD